MFKHCWKYTCIWIWSHFLCSWKLFSMLKNSVNLPIGVICRGQLILCWFTVNLSAVSWVSLAFLFRMYYQVGFLCFKTSEGDTDPMWVKHVIISHWMHHKSMYLLSRFQFKSFLFYANHFLFNWFYVVFSEPTSLSSL